MNSKRECSLLFALRTLFALPFCLLKACERANIFIVHQTSVYSPMHIAYVGHKDFFRCVALYSYDCFWSFYTYNILVTICRIIIMRTFVCCDFAIIFRFCPLVVYYPICHLLIHSLFKHMKNGINNLDWHFHF